MISKVTFTPPTAGASAITLHDPANNTTRYLSKIDGVVGPPTPRDVTRIIPGADGVVDATAHVGERNITLEGELFGTSAGVSLSDLSTLSQAFMDSLLSPGKLTVTYENGTERFAWVKLSGPVETSVEGAARLVQYQVQFRAADPRWYSTTLNTKTLNLSGLVINTSTTGTNAGTAPAPLEIVITTTSGTINADKIEVTVPTAYASLIPSTYSATGTQSIVSTSWASGGSSGSSIVVSSGSSRTFTTATRTATSLANVASVSEFPFVYPGGAGSSTFSFFGVGTSSPAGTCVFKWYDAFW